MGQVTEAGLRGIVVDQITKAAGLAKKSQYGKAWDELAKAMDKLRVLEDMADGK